MAESGMVESGKTKIVKTENGNSKSGKMKFEKNEFRLINFSSKYSLKRFEIIILDLRRVSWTGLGNDRPAAHMRPVKHLNVNHEHYFWVDKTFKMLL